MTRGKYRSRYGDGGNGCGGDVAIEAVDGLTTLIDYRYPRAASFDELVGTQ
jgi:GTPase involved in cell partitioning and DNA repair